MSRQNRKVPPRSWERAYGLLAVIPKHKATQINAAIKRDLDDVGGDKTFTVGYSNDGGATLTHYVAATTVSNKTATLNVIKSLLQGNQDAQIWIWVNGPKGSTTELIAEFGTETNANIELGPPDHQDKLEAAGFVPYEPE